MEKLCKFYNIKVKFSPKLARGLSYYTGNIFEATSPDYKFTIAAGGRYDNKVGMYAGRKIPAVGISFGLDRLAEIAKIKVEGTKCLIININQDKKSIEIAQKLRKNNISVTIQDKISKALEYANSLQIPFVIFLGKEEIKKKKFKLRDMQTGKEKMLSEKELIEKLKC